MRNPGQPELANLHQDAYRRVILGQASDPIFPPHPGPPEFSDEELTTAALADPFHPRRRRRWGFSPLWPLIGLVALALITLSLVLWRRG